MDVLLFILIFPYFLFKYFLEFLRKIHFLNYLWKKQQQLTITYNKEWKILIVIPNDWFD